MFNHECTQRQGEVVGACMDGFLFGTCCQLSGTFDAPVAKPSNNMPASNYATAQSYEKYGSGSQDFDYNTKDTVKNKLKDSYGEVVEVDGDLTAVVNDDEQNNSLGYPDLLTVHSYTNSPSYSTPHVDKADDQYISSTYFSSPTQSSLVGEMYLPPSPSQSYSPEVPSKLNSYNQFAEGASTEANDFTSDGIQYIAQTFLTDKADSQNLVFDHSGITHPDVDTVLLQDTDNEIESVGYGGPQPQQDEEPVVTRRPATSPKPDPTTTLKATKATPPKIQFKPKPTKTEPFVLVTTLTYGKNDTSKATSGYTSTTVGSSIGESESHQSIESILLMLNDSKVGPQYETHTEPEIIDFDYDMNTHHDTEETNHYETPQSSTPAYPSTTMINYDKYGSTSFYITTKVPNSRPSSSNYIYSNYKTNKIHLFLLDNKGSSFSVRKLLGNFPQILKQII
jgi:hypothetical protein